MALTTCKDCGNQVSTDARACPKCGRQLPARTSVARIVGLLLILLVVPVYFAVRDFDRAAGRSGCTFSP
jgi:hypothetical protein